MAPPLCPRAWFFLIDLMHIVPQRLLGILASSHICESRNIEEKNNKQRQSHDIRYLHGSTIYLHPQSYYIFTMLDKNCRDNNYSTLIHKNHNLKQQTNT